MFYRIREKIFSIWRKKRFDDFLKIIAPSSTETLLDVGGTPSFWIKQPQPVKKIDSLNLTKIEYDIATHPEHVINTLAGDACSLPFADNSYDIGFSNSVIEHVGSWERQQQFASEIRRVSKALWVQTPAYECPIEPHYLGLFIHYFPRYIQPQIIRWFTIWGIMAKPESSYIQMMVEETRLLRKREMETLFPDCDIITERMFGFIPKSYIAVRRAR